MRLHRASRGVWSLMCAVEFVKWFWTGPYLVTCRLTPGHSGEHSEIPPSAEEA